MRLSILDKKNAMKQFAKYTLIGISSTIVQYSIYVLLYQATQNYYIANIAAFVVSVFHSYYWNRHIVFCNQATTIWWKVLLKNYALYFSTGVCATNLLSYVMIDIWFISPYAAPIIIVLLLYPVNYLLNKFWAHKGSVKINFYTP